MSTQNASPAPHKQSSGLSKYLGLIVLVVLFLLLTVGMLASSAYVTKQQGHAAQELVAATRQNRLIQQLAKNSMDLDLYIDAALGHSEVADSHDHAAASAALPEGTVAIDRLPQNALYALEEMKSMRDEFETTLSAFEKGGTVQLVAGSIDIAPMQGENAAELLASIRNVWNPYLGLVDNFLADAKKGQVNRQSTEYLVEYARLYTQNLMENSIAANQVLNDNVATTSAFWNKVQLGGIAAAFVLFLMIVFGALRQLVNNDTKLAITGEQLAIANQEMSEIMTSVNEGLFLLDKNLIIGGQYSARLEGILGQTNLGGKNLLDVLAELVPNEDLETTKVFIDQLYSDWVVEDLIEDLNPLHRISIQDDYGNDEKFLDFKFFRVWLNEKIERILVSVTDTTESVLLQASLDAQKEQEGRELEMLNIILNTNPVLLDNFIQNSQKRLDDINQVLKSPDSNRLELRTKVQYIAREIHTLKGEASSLKLHRMVNICETFEESLRYMKTASNLSGQDFLGLVVLLEDLYRLFDVLEGYNARVGSGNVKAAEGEQSPEQASRKMAQAQESHFKQFVTDIADRYHKKVELSVSGFESNPLSGTQWDKLKDIIIQLLRNSVVHGIESPEIRRQRNKSETGSLKLTLSAQPDGNMLLVAEDDGNGINFEAIRAKAVSSGLATAEDAARLTQPQMLNLMFSSGFSTAESETEDAGRGVGMDIIKATIQSMGGRISIATVPEGYTRFNLSFKKSV